MKPIVFYDNLMLSGSVSGTEQSTDNVVREVADGSINLGYTVASDVSPTLQSGSVTLVLVSAQLPVTFILPKCELQSGHTLKLQSMTDVGGTDTVDLITQTFSGETRFFKQDLPATSGQFVWRVLISGASGLEPPLVHEIQLATTKYQVARPAQVLVDRTRVRQFTRIPVPGGQPFVKRDGPRLRRYGYTFILVSGAAEIAPARDFIDAVEGGEAFTLQDDLGDCYWAELLGNDISEADSAGVSTLRLTFQEIKVD